MINVKRVVNVRDSQVHNRSKSGLKAVTGPRIAMHRRRLVESRTRSFTRRSMREPTDLLTRIPAVCFVLPRSCMRAQHRRLCCIQPRLLLWSEKIFVTHSYSENTSNKYVNIYIRRRRHKSTIFNSAYQNDGSPRNMPRTHCSVLYQVHCVQRP